MRKKALLAVMMLMLLTLVLTGCRLIVKDQAVDDATPILTLGDEVMTKKEVKEALNTLYTQYGISPDDADSETLEQVQDIVIEGLKQDMVLKAKRKELNLEDLSEEDLAQIQEDAQKTYDEDLEMVKAYYLTDEELQLEGDALREAAVNKLTAMGYKFESYEKNARTEFINNRLREYIVKDVEVTEEELTEEFNSRVASDEEKYAENAGSWVDSYLNGTALYYTPAGVRLIKNILIKFTDADQTAIDEAKSAVSDAETKVSDAEKKISDAQAVLDDAEASDEDKAKAQEDLTAAEEEKAAADKEHDEAHTKLDDVLKTAYANIDAEADEVLAELANGADWDTLMAAKTQDPGMQGNSDTAVNGYTVASGMTKFDSAFVDAAMALNAIGDTSDKVPSDMYGYYIVKYVKDAETGPISIDAVRDTINDALLSSKQDKTYNDTIKQWVSDADFKEDLKALKD